jgi:hypothetical protein
MLKDMTILMQDDTVVGISNDTGSRVYLGDGIVYPMEGNQGQQGGNAPALWRPGRGGKESVTLQDSRCEPGFELSTDTGWRLRFGQKRLVTDTVEAFRDVNLERVLRSKRDIVKDCPNRIPTGTPGAKAIGLG